MGTWAPWDYIISYIGITAVALILMQIAHNRAMDKLANVYEQGLADQKRLIDALQSMVAILQEIVHLQRKERP